MMESAQVGIAQKVGQKPLARGVTMTSFNAFTGGSIFEFRLNSGKESPFYANFYAMNVVNGKGEPSALNSKKVNPVLLAVVAAELGKMKVQVVNKEGQKQGDLKLFLEPKQESPSAVFTKSKLGPDDVPKSVGLYDPDNHELHG